MLWPLGEEVGGVTNLIFLFAAAFTGLLAVAVLGRLVAGPTVADRAVALDTMNTLVVGLMMILAAVYDSWSWATWP